MTGAAGAVTGGGTQVTSDPGCCLYTVSTQGPFVDKAPVVNIIVYKGQFNADFFTIIQFLLPFSTCHLEGLIHSQLTWDVRQGYYSKQKLKLK